MQKLKAALSSPAWICFTWFGLTTGVSVLSTPVRFTAPTVTREVAVDIGRVTFAALNKAELVALIILLIVVRASGRAKHWWAVCALLSLIMIVQSAWLLPELMARAEMVVSGIDPQPSSVHTAYTALELCKLGILLVAGFMALGERDAHARIG